MAISPNGAVDSEPTVADIMGDFTAVVQRPAHLAAAAYLMQEAQTPALLVIDNDVSRGPVAIITARDIVRAVAHGINANDERVTTWETPDPLSVRPETTVREAIDLMIDQGRSQLPVVDDAHAVVGMIDLFNYVRLTREAERTGRVQPR